MDNAMKRLKEVAEQASAVMGQPITAEDLHRIATALDAELHAPLPHRTPSLARINHYWRHR